MAIDWEAICNQCGLCCHEKVVLDDALIIDPDSPCSFFDTETRLCKVYEERFEKCPRCQKVGLKKAMFSPALPAGCGYVQWAEKHHIRFARKRELVFGNLD